MACLLGWSTMPRVSGTEVCTFSRCHVVSLTYGETEAQKGGGGGWLATAHPRKRPNMYTIKKRCLSRDTVLHFPVGGSGGSGEETRLHAGSPLPLTSSFFSLHSLPSCRPKIPHCFTFPSLAHVSTVQNTLFWTVCVGGGGCYEPNVSAKIHMLKP